MNILFLEQYSEISGGQLCLLEILEHLDREEYNPFVVVPEAGQLPEALREMGIESVIMPFGSYSQGEKTAFDVVKMVATSIWLIPKMIKFIRENRINLVYANAPRTLLWGTLAARLAGVPVVWHLHLILRGRKAKAMVRLLLRLGVDHVITVSKAVADSFITPKHKPKHLSVVYNGADLNRFNPAIASDKFRREFALAPHQLAIGIIGQISAEKGHLTFINVAAVVCNQHPDARFFIVGGQPFGEGGIPFINELMERVSELGLTENVVFTGPRSDIPDILAGLDILVSASEVPEACPRVVIEGMASGKVVIATENGAVPEIIDDNSDGLLFPVNDHEKLAQLIEAVFNDSELHKAIKAGAREKAEVKFDLKCYHASITDILKSFV